MRDLITHLYGGGGEYCCRGEACLRSRHSNGGRADHLTGQGADGSQRGDGGGQGGVGTGDTATSQASGDGPRDGTQSSDTWRTQAI